MKILKKTKLILFLILILAATLRLVLLDRLPTGISNDELHFVLNAKSVFLNFSSLSGSNWNPLSFQTIPNEVSSELPFAIISPLIGLLPTNLFTARLPFVLISLLSIFLIYQITQKLTKNSSLALFSAFVTAINPWSIYVSRTSFDAPVALLFFLLSIYLLCFNKAKYIIFSFLSSLVAFYCYIGTKVVYLPFVLLTNYFFWKYIYRQKNTKYFIFTSFLALFITLNFVFSLKGSVVGKRSSELLSPNSPKIISEVEMERNQSLISPFTQILDNRYSIYLRNFIHKYLYNFSTDILFLDGDHTFMVSLWKLGYFYYLDIVFLIFGIIYLFNRHRHFFYYLSLLVLLSPIPEAVRADTIPAFAFHSALQYPFLFIITGAGLYYLFILLKNIYLKIALSLAILLLLLNFINTYFYKYPVYQSEGFFVSRRLVSKYLNLEKNHTTKLYVLTSEPDSLFRNYLFYSNLVNKKNLSKIKEQYSLHPDRQRFDWENITFTSTYPKDVSDQNTYVIDKNFNDFQINDPKHLLITNFVDQSEIYRIVYDKNCHLNNLNYSLKPLKLSDLKIEKLDSPTFCQTFILQNREANQGSL